VDEAPDLRKILSRNIRNARSLLRISQAKLAEHSHISLSYLTDIERCKTWVSDKTLAGIARALNMEAHELLIPEKAPQRGGGGGQAAVLPRIAELVRAKRALLRQKAGETMDDLVLEIAHLYEKADKIPGGE
jgi:transcriptional regulator with XRE-family HTH domain